LAGVLSNGYRTWSMTRDEDGNREYKIVHLVKVDDPGEDGPAQAILTPGLPLPGSYWAFGNDVDLWAFCRPNADIKPHQEKEGDPAEFFYVEQTFSTRPTNKCQDIPIEDPLMEPQKVSGSFVKFSEEAFHDRFGRPIANSSHEQVRGPQVEFDRNRPTIRIEQNVPILNAGLFSAMVDTVNKYPLWGLPPRCVKLSNVSWERKYHGQCNVYYSRVLEFDINFESFDRDLVDEGNKVISGHMDETTGAWVLDPIAGGDPNPLNPLHFIRYKDRNDENARTILDGTGQPWNPTPPPTVDDCGQCSLAPQYWEVFGFENVNVWLPAGPGVSGVIPYPRPSTGVVMEYVSGCTWSVTVGEYIFELKYYDNELLPNSIEGFAGEPFNPFNQGWAGDDPVTGWHLVRTEVNDPSRTTIYNYQNLVPLIDWRCLGTNRLFRGFRPQDPEDGQPPYIQIAPYDPNQSRPGSIHVERYGESDFLLLGIPLAF
jgi:hypothetical protein